ncbi:MAG: tRNA (adenosine(37)-N6)-threonylcarbamoyltransferase complex transferase subunit TsaD [Spirochaetia bacterium]|nr:tRNA (adenosine(37)-N6)-threonylcarbamoyltransferase complex transferase subunit TsaD [Spirochaetia bacterium]
MNILGIESSCDECSAAVVVDGKKVLSNVVATQIAIHQPFMGVVPEIASRTHVEWIKGVVRTSLEEAGCTLKDIDGIAVTAKPGLVGSLLVGVNYAKSLAYAADIPYVGIDHIFAHIHAAHVEYDIQYPYIALLVSGGHTLIAVMEDYDKMNVMGTTIDDACGEAFDKIAKFYGWGYPGGIIIDRMAQKGDVNAFSFPDPSLHKGEHKYDVSYSGLKTAVINQLHQFQNDGYEATPENIAASFQKAAIDMLIRRVKKACRDSGLNTIVTGGGVAANSYLRKSLTELKDTTVYIPSMKLCGDNGAMVAGLGYHFLKDGMRSDLSLNAMSKVMAFHRSYP